MNVSILEDENYLEQLNKRVKLICLTNDAFGTGSNTIRLHAQAISYSKEKAKLKYEKEQRIQQQLEDANRLFENDPSASNRLRLDKIKEKLELLCEEKVKGIVIRATARWHEYGERSTKYFLNLEKRNHVKNTCENC